MTNILPGAWDKPAPEQSQPWTCEKSLGCFQEELRVGSPPLVLLHFAPLQKTGEKKGFVLCKLPCFACPRFSCSLPSLSYQHWESPSKGTDLGGDPLGFQPC